VRTLMICARTGMSKVFVLTTVFSERVVDALFLLAISGTILLTLPVTPGWLARAARPSARSAWRASRRLFDPFFRDFLA